MGSQTQKTVGRKATNYAPADQPSCSSFHNVTGLEGNPAKIDSAGPTCYRSISNQDGGTHKDRKGRKQGRGTQRHSCYLDSNTQSPNCRFKPLAGQKSLPEQLAELIRTIICADSRAEEMIDAFQHAGEYPPITRQSLAELDIQNIINNIKLRHDVNFDRDLSFRPNLDGTKGQEKLKASKRYWNALCVELKLYMFLFQGVSPNGVPSITTPQSLPNFKGLTQYVKRRIPIMFETIREILKSLVPDRDQSRVDEHLDVVMLMQEIEKGVCDQVRLSEWLANLIKEHCAPMRDERVDKMVECTKEGVSNISTESIVSGLRELLGILEAMKLDVANHQIRNLKALLIEDTVNFERNYHLGRIVSGRSRININAIQQWYSFELQRFRPFDRFASKGSPRFQLEVFARAVTSLLFSTDVPDPFPETFYLDQDRLQNLRDAIYDLVMFEICFTLFSGLLRRLAYRGTILESTKITLRNALFAILGDGQQHSTNRWQDNYDHISLQMVRYAWEICGFTHKVDLSLASETSQLLHQMVAPSYPQHASVLEASFVAQVLTCINSHMNLSPLDLFNALVAPPNPPPPPPPSQNNFPVQSHVTDTLSSHFDQLTDLTNRLTHIILLHWRTWGPIVYVISEEDDTATFSASGPLAEKDAVSGQQPSSTQEPLSVDNTQHSISTVTRGMEDSTGQDPQQEASIPGSASETSAL